MARLPFVVALLGALAIAPRAEAQTAGINMGAPVSNGVLSMDAAQASIGTGAAHVRVNFILDKWSSPTDQARYGGKTFFEAYDAIVDAITSQGLEVYGLLNDELASAGAPNTAELEDSYAANVLAVVDHFKDRVRVWETLNEPNNYADGTSSARFSAASFANAHGRVYDEVKVQHPGDACWDVKLVTGPLFSFDGTSGAEYFDQTIAAGRAAGKWKYVYDTLGRDPIDDVGYHLYVAQGPDSAPSEVAASAGANLAAMNAVLAKYGITGKNFWISEIGFRVPLFDEAGQAGRVDTTFAALGAPARSDIASIQWFTIADFGGEGWGLYGASLAAKDRRPSYDRFVAQAKAFAPDLAARLVVTLPKQATAGATVIAKVTASNLGKTSWDAASLVRLGAASGCPSAWSINGATWQLAAADGYVHSALDARRFLPANASVAQGQSVVLDVPLVMPLSLGKQHFAARMVREGVTWFGATAMADIDVVPVGAPHPGLDGGAASGPSPAGGPPSNTATDGAASSTGCSCRETPSREDRDVAGGAKGVLFGLSLALIALRARRRVKASS